MSANICLASKQLLFSNACLFLSFGCSVKCDPYYISACKHLSMHQSNSFFSPPVNCQIRPQSDCRASFLWGKKSHVQSEVAESADNVPVGRALSRGLAPVSLAASRITLPSEHLLRSSWLTVLCSSHFDTDTSLVSTTTLHEFLLLSCVLMLVSEAVTAS